ncbi:MAG: hypothetical protein ACKVOP_03100 [Sphingomonadaceae bacterium]
MNKPPLKTMVLGNPIVGLGIYGLGALTLYACWQNGDAWPLGLMALVAMSTTARAGEQADAYRNWKRAWDAMGDNPLPSGRGGRVSTTAMLALAMGTAPLPRYRPSDAFVFSDGRVERVVRIQRNRITWAGLNGPSYVRDRNFMLPVLQWRSGKGMGERRIVGSPQQIWPLDRPKSVRFRAVAQTRTKPLAGWRRSATLWTCKSAKPRTVTLKLGTFQTYPLSCDRYSATTMRLIERLEWDYAPDLNHYIRRTSVDYFRGTRTNIELVAALSGPAANRRRLAAIVRAERQNAAVTKAAVRRSPPTR